MSPRLKEKLVASTAPRPVGVTVVAVLMIISGIIGVLAGIVSLVGAGSVGSVGSVEVDGVALDSTAITVVGVLGLVFGVLNILFAIGILRGSNVVRIIVSILQVLSLASSVYTLVSGGSIWQALQTIIFPLLILILLWVGEKTKAFFAG